MMNHFKLSGERSGRVGLSVLVAGVILIVGIGIAWQVTRPPAITTESTAPDPEVQTHRGLPWFEDRTRGSGMDFTYLNGEEADQFTILESLGGGVALLDYDGDGLLDVFLPGGGQFTGPAKTDITGLPCRLYRNLGGFRFQDVTAAVGLERTWWYTHGAAVADYDCDGWPDLLVTGYGRIGLFHNEANPAGGRRFVERTEQLKLTDDSWSTSAAWADVNGDGFPDLYVCRYVDWSFANNPTCSGYIQNVPRDVCAPQRFKPLIHALFINEKGQSFREVGREHGFTPTGCGLGVVATDVNADGRPDFAVANDATNNFLFLNRNGKLEEVGWRAGVAVDENGRYNGSMGIDVGDYDGTGRGSLWVTNFQGEMPALYRNLGHSPPNEAFDHQSRAAGVAVIGTHLVGFGTAFVDVDCDGWEDLAILHGHVIRKPSLGSTFRQKPVLLRNIDRGGRRAFENASDRGGEYFTTPTLGRGLAVGDLDNDGRPDLVASHTNSPVAVLRNVAAPPNARWIGVKLVGRNARDIVGSTVTVNGALRKITRFAKSGGSYLSSSDPRLLFGLGEETIRSVTVKWSWGETQTWENLEPGSYWELREGEPAAKKLPPAN
jgi:enediyne biosynthesis protein E4